MYKAINAVVVSNNLKLLGALGVFEKETLLEPVVSEILSRLPNKKGHSFEWPSKNHSSANYFLRATVSGGSITESTTWITPLVAMMSALTT